MSYSDFPPLLSLVQVELQLKNGGEIKRLKQLVRNCALVVGLFSTMPWINRVKEHYTLCLHINVTYLTFYWIY